MTCFANQGPMPHLTPKRLLFYGLSGWESQYRLAALLPLLSEHGSWKVTVWARESPMHSLWEAETGLPNLEVEFCGSSERPTGHWDGVVVDTYPDGCDHELTEGFIAAQPSHLLACQVHPAHYQTSIARSCLAAYRSVWWVEEGFVPHWFSQEVPQFGRLGSILPQRNSQSGHERLQARKTLLLEPSDLSLLVVSCNTAAQSRFSLAVGRLRELALLQGLKPHQFRPIFAKEIELLDGASRVAKNFSAYDFVICQASYLTARLVAALTVPQAMWTLELDYEWPVNGERLRAQSYQSKPGHWQTHDEDGLVRCFREFLGARQLQSGAMVRSSHLPLPKISPASKIASELALQVEQT